MDPLLILCCFGGEPFLDFHAGAMSRQIDPTEWVAQDIAGFLLQNESWIPQHHQLDEAGVNLSECDLFNITFASSADAALATRAHAGIACRCPWGLGGVACELRQPRQLAFVSNAPTSSAMLLIVAAVLLILLFVICLMVRNCFCDCFGPFVWGFQRTNTDDDPPLDRADLEKCLRKVREFEARREFEASPSTIIPPPTTTAAPYDQPVPATAPPRSPPNRNQSQYRPPSPPPSYSSIAGSHERLPQSSI